MMWIKLTDEQFKLLAEEGALVRRAKKIGTPGSLLAQVYPDENIMRVQFVPEEVAIEIINILKAYGIYRENRIEVSENPTGMHG